MKKKKNKRQLEEMEIKSVSCQYSFEFEVEEEISCLQVKDKPPHFAKVVSLYSYSNKSIITYVLNNTKSF